MKSSPRWREADTAQVVHYCYRLHQVGVDVQGGILHYPASRRTVRVAYEDSRAARALADIRAVTEVAAQDTPPTRLEQRECGGCSFFDYCWTE